MSEVPDAGVCPGEWWPSAVVTIRDEARYEVLTLTDRDGRLPQLDWALLVGDVTQVVDRWSDDVLETRDETRRGPEADDPAGLGHLTSRSDEHVRAAAWFYRLSGAEVTERARLVRARAAALVARCPDVRVDFFQLVRSDVSPTPRDRSVV